MVMDNGWGGQYGLLASTEVRGWLAAVRDSLEVLELNEKKAITHSWAKYHLLAGQTALGIGEFDFSKTGNNKSSGISP